MVNVTHHSDHRGPSLEIFLLLLFRNLLNDFFFEGNDVHDSAEGLGQARCRGHVQGVIDRGKDATVEQFFQDIFGAHIQLLREFADGDALGDGNVARRTRWLGNGLDARGAALSYAGARANRMQLAFTLFEALF